VKTNDRILIKANSVGLTGRDTDRCIATCTWLGLHKIQVWPENYVTNLQQQAASTTKNLKTWKVRF